MVSKVEDAPNKSLKLATWQNAGNFHAIHVPVARAIPISGSSTGAFGGLPVFWTLSTGAYMRPTQWEYKSVQLDVAGWFTPDVQPDALDAALNEQASSTSPSTRSEKCLYARGLQPRFLL